MKSKVLDYSFEDELGVSGIPGTLDFEISYTYHPGEKMVRYYRDGSGYPGSPPEVELFDIRCVGISSPVLDRETLPLENIWFGSWFEEYLERNKDEYERIYEKVVEDVEEGRWSEE